MAIKFLKPDIPIFLGKFIKIYILIKSSSMLTKKIWSEHELYWKNIGFLFISDCMYNSRVKCPYTDGIFKLLYMYNTIYIPLFIMFVFHIKKISVKYKKILFTEDTYYIYLIYKKLFPKDVCDLFFVSSYALNNPTTDFNLYVKNIIITNTLIIHMNTLEYSLKNYLSKTGYDIICLAKLINMNNINLVNYVRFGSFLTFKENKPVFILSNYPQYLSYPIEQTVFYILEFITNSSYSEINLEKLSEYIKKYGNNTILKSLTNEYKTKKEKVNTLWKEEFGLFFKDGGVTLSKKYKDMKVYIINIPNHIQRKTHIINLLHKLGIHNYEFVIPMAPTDETKQKLAEFLKCNIGNIKTTLTSVSHTMTYYNILNKVNDDNILILEDDIEMINSLEDTKIVIDYIINNYPTDTDLFYLEYCYETCNTKTKIFKRLNNPLCLASIYYPTKKSREKILNCIKQFCQMNEFHATDIVIAKIIYDTNIIAYEHKLLFYQDKKFGSHIEGSTKSVTPICTNIKNKKCHIVPLKSSNKNYAMYYIIFSISIICGIIVYKIQKLYITIVFLILLVIVLLYLFPNTIHKNYTMFIKELYNLSLFNSTKQYDLFTEYYGYRLGDMVNHLSSRNGDDGKTFHYKNFPNSIASKYMKETNETNNINILYKIVKNTYGDMAPSDCLVIHLRVGDVLNINYTVEDMLQKHVKQKWDSYVKPLKFFFDKNKKMDNYGIKKVILVAGSHYNMCFYKSTIYINCIKIFFEKKGKHVILRLGKDTDNDIVFMSSAKYFSKTGGGFSKIVEKLVKKNGGIIF